MKKNCNSLVTYFLLKLTMLYSENVEVYYMGNEWQAGSI